MQTILIDKLYKIASKPTTTHPLSPPSLCYRSHGRTKHVGRNPPLSILSLLPPHPIIVRMVEQNTQAASIDFLWAYRSLGARDDPVDACVDHHTLSPLLSLPSRTLLSYLGY
jgi:hypothetical protein